MAEYYHEGAINPEDKDCRIRLMSTWIWTVSELGATTRKNDREALKSFLTLETVRDRKWDGKYTKELGWRCTAGGLRHFLEAKADVLEVKDDARQRVGALAASRTAS